MKNIFIIQHTQSSSPGQLLLGLQRLGFNLSLLKLFEQPEFKVPKKFDGVVILGGGMSVNDEKEYKWNLPECEFIREIVKKEIPLLGICLGGQMIAKAHGAVVKKNHHPEFGWSLIKPTEFALRDKFYKIGNGLPVYQWHYETFALPPGAVRLAHSDSCNNQAYKLGERCYGLQYHPETYPQMIHDWVYLEEGEAEINELRQLGHTQFVQPGALHWDWSKKYAPAQNEHLFQILKIFE